jgi:hypothetical protein
MVISDHITTVSADAGVSGVEVGVPSIAWQEANHVFDFHGSAPTGRNWGWAGDIEWPQDGGGSIPQPDFVVLGPYVAYETKFFIQKFKADLNRECKIWLDVDADPDPDVALTLQQVCESDISDRVKLAMHAQLLADLCSGLPCVTAAGNLQKKYSEESKDN